MVPLRNRKHEAFAREVAAMTPYAKAYEMAGYTGAPKWWEYNARKLAQQPEVRARIEELQTEFARMAGLHAAYIQRQLLPIVEANPQDLYRPDGSLRPITELPRALAKAIHKIKHDPETGKVIEISLFNPNEAGSTLLRSVPNGVIQRNEHAGADGPPINVRVVRYTDELAAEAAAKQEAADSATVPVVNLVRYDPAD